MKVIQKVRKKFIPRLLLPIFVIVGLYFGNMTSKFDYLGISLQSINNRWIIKELHEDGTAKLKNLVVGDEIIEINHQNSSDNKLLNQWLIVEQASSVMVRHHGKNELISFENKNGLKPSFIILSLLSIVLFATSYIYHRGYEISRTSRRYNIFLILTSFFIISVVPSSMGNLLARMILVLYITLFPMFIDFFWRAIVLKQESAKLSNFSKSVIGYSIFTIIILCFNSFFITLPLLTYFLTRVVLYISFSLLLLLLCISTFENFRKKLPLKLNLVMLVILSVIPLFLGYVFPLPYRIPFISALPLLVLPILAIINDLIIHRFTNFRFQHSQTLLYSYISMMVTVVIVCLSFISHFIPWWITIIYIFITSLCYLPILKDIILINNKMTYKMEGQTIFSAIELEREEISTYIHDSIIQDIIYFKKKIENEESVSKEQVLSILDDSIFELRELCSNIYPLMIQELGLKSAILEIIDKFQKTESVLIESNFTIENLNLGDKESNFILRSIKEMINNSILHGGAKWIKISLYSINDFIFVDILDDGTFSKNLDNQGEVSHFGLNAIAEKLSLLGGELTIHTQPTNIILKIPRRSENGS